MGKTITLTDPERIDKLEGNPAHIKIRKHGNNSYRVERVRINSGTKVEWGPDNIGTPPFDDIVVKFPPLNEEMRKSSFPVTIVGAPGTYRYSLKVIVNNGAEHDVEGNSPPEMIIE